MSSMSSPDKILNLSISETEDHERICKIAHAISVPERVKILQVLLAHTQNISELATTLNIPVSSVSRHVEVLSDAQLLHVSYQPGRKGHTKYCSQMIVACNLNFGLAHIPSSIEHSVEMPLGMFTECSVTAPCGMVGKTSKIGVFDEPSVFFAPERVNAECIWFNSGFISYAFPVTHARDQKCSEISFSLEMCSETIYYNDNWPSDITFYVNNKEIITVTSLGDFGGRRGKYTPDFWPITSTQYGVLKKITINSRGVFVDDSLKHTQIVFDDLNLSEGNSIRFTIGIKEDAEHRGGINLFGKNFGDHPQSIIMTLR